MIKHLMIACLSALGLGLTPMAGNAHPLAAPSSQIVIAPSHLVEAGCYDCCYDNCGHEPYRWGSYHHEHWHHRWRSHFRWGSYGGYGHDRAYSHNRWGSYYRYWRPDRSYYGGGYVSPYAGGYDRPYDGDE